MLPQCVIGSVTPMKGKATPCTAVPAIPGPHTHSTVHTDPAPLRVTSMSKSPLHQCSFYAGPSVQKQSDHESHLDLRGVFSVPTQGVSDATPWGSHSKLCSPQHTYPGNRIVNSPETILIEREPGEPVDSVFGLSGRHSCMPQNPKQSKGAADDSITHQS